jgi:PTH1 family peptidyl-tRNA hydrolase
MAIDDIAKHYNANAWKEKSKGLYTDIRLNGQKIYLLKPQTYMNLSGESVQSLAAFFKIPVQDIFVFHDELDIDSGKLKVKKGGGSAGHNGLKSITQCMATDDYHRIRMGIGHPGSKARVNGHVLGNFHDNDYDWIDPMLKSIADHMPDLIQKPNDFAAKVAQDLKKKDIK